MSLTQKIFAILIYLMPLSAISMEKDLFDSTSCAGPAISAETALNLLSDKNDVNLAGALPGSNLVGKSRFRQKLNGAVSKWYDSTKNLQPLEPHLANNRGALQFYLVFYYSKGNPYGDGSHIAKRAISCNQIEASSDFDCINTDPESPSIGSNKLTATLTNDCLRIFSSSTAPDRDYEWSYFMELPTGGSL